MPLQTTGTLINNRNASTTARRLVMWSGYTSTMLYSMMPTPTSLAGITYFGSDVYAKKTSKVYQFSGFNGAVIKNSISFTGISSDLAFDTSGNLLHTRTALDLVRVRKNQGFSSTMTDSFSHTAGGQFVSGWGVAWFKGDVLVSPSNSYGQVLRFSGFSDTVRDSVAMNARSTINLFTDGENMGIGTSGGIVRIFSGFSLTIISSYSAWPNSTGSMGGYEYDPGNVFRDQIFPPSTASVSLYGNYW